MEKQFLEEYFRLFDKLSTINIEMEEYSQLYYTITYIKSLILEIYSNITTASTRLGATNSYDRHEFCVKTQNAISQLKQRIISEYILAIDQRFSNLNLSIQNLKKYNYPIVDELYIYFTQQYEYLHNYSFE